MRLCVPLLGLGEQGSGAGHPSFQIFATGVRWGNMQHPCQDGDKLAEPWAHVL